MIYALDMMQLRLRVPWSVILRIREFMWDAQFADMGHLSYTAEVSEHTTHEWFRLWGRMVGPVGEDGNDQSQRIQANCEASDASRGPLTSTCARSGPDSHEFCEDSAALETIEDVWHEEEPAEISPELAEQTANELWASSVEQRLAAESSESIARPASKRCVLLTFNRDPPEFDAALLGSALAVAAAERGAVLQPAWANGAKVFVEGLQPECFDIALEPRHVVVYEQDVDEVLAVLWQLPYRSRPRPKPGSGISRVPEDSMERSQLGAPPGSSVAVSEETVHENHSDPEVQHVEITVRRTFIHVAVANEVRPASQCTVSTSGDRYAFPNPRLRG